MPPKSFKQMRKDGELVRADAEKIDYFSIHIESGFNPPGRTEENDENDEALYKIICEQGIFSLPQWEVRPREEGGVYIVEGHRRHKQTGRAIKAGIITPDKDGRYLIPVKQFVGNDLDRLYHVKNSNNRKELKPMDLAWLCHRARHGFGEEVSQIAKRLYMPVSAVESALVLASAPHAVQQMVKAGDVAPTTAVTIVKAKGDSAAPMLQEALQAARLQGKSKITAKQLDGNTPADLVRAIQKEIDSGGTFKAEDLAPKFAPLITYLRGTAKP